MNQKTKSNTDIDFSSIFDQFLDQFWTQKRSKIGSGAVSEGLWMRIAFRSSKKRGRSPSVESYPHPKPFQNRFGTDFEAILAPKMVQKWSKNQSRIDVCIRFRFLINFLSKKFMLQQSLELAKSIKTNWFFNILAYSACYKLS